MKIIPSSFVQATLNVQNSIELMETVLSLKNEGQTMEPLRTILSPTDAKGRMFVMPSFIQTNQAFYCIKFLGVFEDNPKRDLSSRQGGILLFSGETGIPLAMMEAEQITYFRTAAVSAIATQLLSRPDSTRLAIIGTGLQAQYHAKTLSTVRPIKHISLVGRDLKKTEKIASELQSQLSCPVEACDDIASAVKMADIIVTATSSKQPVLKHEWLKPGAHVNSIGAVNRTSRELDDGIIQNAQLFVDSRVSFQSETGDWLIPFEQGTIGEENICGELHELFSSPNLYHRNNEDLTVFKSVGLSIQDSMMAQYIYNSYLKES